MMARAGLLDHRKFKKLCHILKEPVPHVLGYLECMWVVSNQQRDAYIGDKLDVALATQFPGDAEVICEGLVNSGFLDRLPDGSLQVHDFLEHAPPYVRRHVKSGLPETSRRLAVGLPVVNHRVATGWKEKRREEKRREERRIRKINPPTPPYFKKPTVDEIAAYCAERKNGIDAERFFDHYESNGWKVGKSAMKDWRAAVRNWERNQPKKFK